MADSEIFQRFDGQEGNQTIEFYFLKYFEIYNKDENVLTHIYKR